MAINAVVFGVQGNVQRRMKNPDHLMSHFVAGSAAGNILLVSSYLHVLLYHLNNCMLYMVRSTACMLCLSIFPLCLSMF